MIAAKVDVLNDAQSGSACKADSQQHSTREGMWPSKPVSIERRHTSKQATQECRGTVLLVLSDREIAS
jgi:hypothetical protein